ncbi:hypothetical protein ABZ755_14225, partial [Streptomyces griseoincarnatus]
LRPTPQVSHQLNDAHEQSDTPLTSEDDQALLGVDGMSTADSTQVVQSTDKGTEGHEWRFV